MTHSNGSTIFSAAILSIVLSAIVFAQSSSGRPDPGIGSMIASNDTTYRIGAGDLLDVRVLNHPEMSKKARYFMIKSSN